MASTLVERGALEPVAVSDVVCRVKARTKGSAIATTIRWVIDDGTAVKKGDRLVELDDSGIAEQILAQKVAHEQAVAARARAEEDLKRAQKFGQVDVRLGEIAVRRAELELKQAAGADKEQRETLELHIERAKLQYPFEPKVRWLQIALWVKALGAQPPRSGPRHEPSGA